MSFTEKLLDSQQMQAQMQQKLEQLELSRKPVYDTNKPLDFCQSKYVIKNTMSVLIAKFIYK